MKSSSTSASKDDIGFPWGLPERAGRHPHARVQSHHFFCSRSISQFPSAAYLAIMTKLARIFLPKLSLSTTTSVLCTLRPLIPFLFNILYSCHMPDIITSSFCTTRLNLLRMWSRMMSFDHPLLSADVSLSFTSDEGGGEKRATTAAKMPRSQHDVRWSE